MNDETIEERMKNPEELKRAAKYIALGENKRHERLLKLGKHALNKAKFPYSGPAVYFLWDAGEVVYIGQAVNLMRRVAEHVRTKAFDEFSYIECKAADLNDLERRAILWFMPRMNRK